MTSVVGAVVTAPPDTATRRVPHQVTPSGLPTDGAISGPVDVDARRLETSGTGPAESGLERRHQNAQLPSVETPARSGVCTPLNGPPTRRRLPVSWNQIQISCRYGLRG